MMNESQKPRINSILSWRNPTYETGMRLVEQINTTHAEIGALLKKLRQHSRDHAGQQGFPSQDMDRLHELFNTLFHAERMRANTVTPGITVSNTIKEEYPFVFLQSDPYAGEHESRGSTEEELQQAQMASETDQYAKQKVVIDHTALRQYLDEQNKPTDFDSL